MLRGLEESYIIIIRRWRKEPSRGHESSSAALHSLRRAAMETCDFEEKMKCPRAAVLCH
jgi:hypothetical protein